MAKSRWEIENQGFNDAKSRYGFLHICHHEHNSLLLQWLITALALTIERLYQLRYLHRGTHPVRSAIELVRLLWLSLGRAGRVGHRLTQRWPGICALSQFDCLRPTCRRKSRL